MKQTTFASLSYKLKKKQTRREKFLSEMDLVVPWKQLVAVIEPHYPKPEKRAHQPMPSESMVRIYFMQLWYAMSDPGMEDALYEIESMRRFAGLELCDDAIPDETTILKFRRLLERHRLTARMMNPINNQLEDKGLLLKGATMVDATIIHAAPSTKNRDKSRDPEMHQTKKGNQWYFGMKVRLGADVNSNLVHTVSVTPANASNISELPSLLREDDRALFGDAAYVSHRFKRAARAAGVFWGVALKAPPRHQAVLGPQLGRAHFPGHEASIRIHESSIPGVGEERGPGIHLDWPHQSVSKAPRVDGLKWSLRLIFKKSEDPGPVNGQLSLTRCHHQPRRPLMIARELSLGSKQFNSDIP